MSIRAIDSQMMITRAAEFTRESSAEVNRSELKHDYLAAQIKAEQEQEQTSVQKMSESQKSELQIDEDDGRNSGDPGKKGKKRKNTDKKTPVKNELNVGLGEDRVIDITV